MTENWSDGVMEWWALSIVAALRESAAIFIPGTKIGCVLLRRRHVRCQRLFPSLHRSTTSFFPFGRPHA